MGVLFNLPCRIGRQAAHNLCTGSSAALALLAENAVQLAERLNQTSHRYHFWQDDGGGDAWCSCPLCRSLSPSDQYTRALNAIVTALRQRFAQRATLSYLAYSDTILPPVKVRPAPGLFLEYAPISRNLSLPVWMQAEATAQLHAWMGFEALDMSEAQVLDYWLDDSLASHWKVGHQVALDFHPRVVAEDARFYHDDVGFGSITCFAAWLNATYVSSFGQPPFREYGEALCPAVKSDDADAGAVPPPFVPWVLAANTSICYGGPFNGTSHCPYLGTFGTEALCRQACTAQPNCTMYGWDNITEHSLLEWRHRCYGRNDDSWTPHFVPNCYSGRRVAPAPAPGPPAPVPPGVLSLQTLPGRPVEPALFGWCMEEWGLILNLTYNDSAGMALTTALHPGVLRYPGGTGSNIWNPRTGKYLPLPAGHSGGYDKWQEFYPLINDFPDGTFSAENFVGGLGGIAKTQIWDLNVFTFNATQACDQIRYISALSGQQAPGILLEFGNELYSQSQGMPFFPNGGAYGAAMVPIVACARKLMPNAKLAACGAGGEWNKGLRPYAHLFDGFTHHNYSPRTPEVDALPVSVRTSYVAGYSRAAARNDVKAQRESLGGVAKPMWLTEFGYGLDPAGQCLMPEMVFGALHGAFHAGMYARSTSCSGTT